MADTDPNSATSALGIEDLRITTGTVTVRWKGGRKARQFVEFSPAPGTGGAWTAVATNEPQTSVTNTFVHDAGTA
ncbi:MAG: hypothetical protein WCR06_07535 [bacterium]